MQLHRILASQIFVSSKRQRKEIKPEDVHALAGSIRSNGLIAPIVIRAGEQPNEYILVAGERRLKALEYLWFFGETCKCGEHLFADGEVPCLFIGELNADDAYEVELEENVRRVDLTWVEQTEAIAELHRRRSARAAAKGESTPAIAELAAEIHGSSTGAIDKARKEILVAPYLSDPEIRSQKTVGDAYKLVKRREETRRAEAVAASYGTSLSSLHELRLGDCFELMAEMPSGGFDVILTDPPYGIDADTFGDSGGHTPGAHFYDDSWETWNNLVHRLAEESFRLAKPQAHLYVFCDIDNYLLLRNMVQEAGWKPFRTPLVWTNPRANRCPWPENGPFRRYQICLYAVKGNRPVTALKSDVVEYPSDDNKGHSAQKPVALYSDLLSRSVRAGDTVLDPFAGTGPIIPAAHALKCRATAIDVDAASYGIMIGRLKELS